MTEIPCPTCSAPVDEADLCWCRNPICLNCCASGEHSWRETEKRDVA